MRGLGWLVLGVLASCGPKNPAGPLAEPADEALEQANQLLSEADALWEERLDEARLVQALGLYEESLQLMPGSRHALTRLTRGHYFWGDAFTVNAAVKRQRWQQALAFGDQCLRINRELARRLETDAPADAMAAATPDDVPCLYWTATSLSRLARAQGLAKTLRFVPTVRAYIGAVDRLDPAYHHYASTRFWGAYYAGLPAFGGRDLDKSREYFAAAIDVVPTYLPTWVLRAEFLHVADQNAGGFDADLQHVLGGDPSTPDDAVPENVKAQEQARRLLNQRNELFTPKALGNDLLDP